MRQEMRQTVMLPYLTVETLVTDPDNLISLLHNRACHSPEEWCPHDTNVIDPAWFGAEVDVDFCLAGVTMFGTHYGKVVPWDRNAAERWDTVGFPRAKLTIESQAILMASLLGISNQIIGNTSSSALPPSGNTKWLEKMTQGMKQQDNSELRSVYTNQAFGRPPTFNVDELLALATARLEAASDHQALLRTDPAYMKHAIEGYAAGCIVQGLRDPASCKEFIHVYLVQEFLFELGTVRHWEIIVEELLNVKNQYIKFAHSIRPGQPLPDEYNRSLAALRSLLMNLIHNLADDIKVRFPTRPGFNGAQYGFRRIMDTWRCNGLEFYGRRKDKNGLWEKDRLVWCLVNLTQEFNSQPRLNFDFIFAVLEDHLRNNAADRKRIDEMLYSQLNDLAATHEIFQAFNCLRPRDTYVDLDDLMTTELGRLGWRFGVMSHQVKDSKRDPRSLKPAADLLMQFRQESTRPVTHDCRARLDNFDRRVSALNEFWTEIHRLRSSELVQFGLPLADVRQCMSVLLLESHPDFVAAIEEQRANLIAAVESADQPRTSPVSEPLQTTWGTGHDGVEVLTSEFRMKLKTRRSELSTTEPTTAQPTVEPATAGATGADVKAHRLKVSMPLPAQCRRVFSRMFPTDVENMGSVEWRNLVRAMVGVGFTAQHKGGSAVVFEHEETSRRIVFHKPHPDSNVHPKMLHAMGRRLSKWFGWDRRFLGLDN